METRIFTYKKEEEVDLTTFIIDGNIWFLATDVCKLLGIQNTPQALAGLDEDEKLLYGLHIAGQMRKVNLVNESGLYNLIFKSKKASAKRFKRWVTKEVLPSIRRTGSYNLKPDELPVFTKRYQLNWANTDKGYFSVLSMLYLTLYMSLERSGYVIPDRTPEDVELRPDNSVGSRFSKFLRKHHPELADKHKPYNQKFPDGQYFQCRQYEIEVLPIFMRYVEDIWLVHHAHEYFSSRDQKALEYLPKLLGKAA